MLSIRPRADDHAAGFGRGFDAAIRPVDGRICARSPVLPTAYTLRMRECALGIRVHHTVAGAGGFFMLVRHLAELYRGLDLRELAHPPALEPYL